MKIMMVEGRYKGEMDYSKMDFSSLPDKLGLVTTVQFVEFVDEFKELLEKNGKTVFVNKMRQIYEGQLLGCDQGAALKNKEEVDAYIYLGTGRFHPLGVAITTEKDVHCYDPLHGIQNMIKKEEGIRLNKKRKAALTAFFSADHIGIVVSTKPGQNQYKRAMKLKERLPEKNVYLFVADTLDFTQLENFPFIQCWVNTACNRIMDDIEKFPKPLLDLSDIEKLNVLTVKI